MDNIEHIVVRANSKQFLLLTKLKVGEFRRSIIIPEGKEKNG